MAVPWGWGWRQSGDGSRPRESDVLLASGGDCCMSCLASASWPRVPRWAVLCCWCGWPSGQGYSWAPPPCPSQGLRGLARCVTWGGPAPAAHWLPLLLFLLPASSSASCWRERGCGQFPHGQQCPEPSCVLAGSCLPCHWPSCSCELGQGKWAPRNPRPRVPVEERSRPRTAPDASGAGHSHPPSLVTR